MESASAQTAPFKPSSAIRDHSRPTTYIRGHQRTIPVHKTARHAPFETLIKLHRRNSADTRGHSRAIMMEVPLGDTSSHSRPSFDGSAVLRSKSKVRPTKVRESRFSEKLDPAYPAKSAVCGDTAWREIVKKHVRYTHTGQVLAAVPRGHLAGHSNTSRIAGDPRAFRARNATKRASTTCFGVENRAWRHFRETCDGSAVLRMTLRNACTSGNPGILWKKMKFA